MMDLFRIHLVQSSEDSPQKIIKKKIGVYTCSLKFYFLFSFSFANFSLIFVSLDLLCILRLHDSRVF